MFTHSMTEQKQVVGRNPKLITERLFPDDTISRYQQGACERFFGTGYAASPKLLRYCFDRIPTAQTQNDIISTRGTHSVQPRRSTC